MTNNITSHINSLRYLAALDDPALRASSATSLASDILAELIQTHIDLAAARAGNGSRTSTEQLRVLAEVVAAGADGIDQSTLGSCVSDLSAEQRTKILAVLGHDGLIESWQVSTGGRPRTLYRWTGAVAPEVTS